MDCHDCIIKLIISNEKEPASQVHRGLTRSESTRYADHAPEILVYTFLMFEVG